MCGIEEPTKEIVDKYRTRFDNSSDGFDDKAVEKVFEALQGDNSKPSIYSKLIILNDRYGLQIKSLEMPSVVDHFHYLYDSHNLYNQIRSGNPDAIKDMRCIQLLYKNSKKETICKCKDFYSLATKYCSFENRVNSERDDYPIYDRFAVGMILELRDMSINYESKFEPSEYFKTFKKSDMRKDYKEYKRIIEEMMAAFNLELNYKELDKYLWEYGKEYSSKEGCKLVDPPQYRYVKCQRESNKKLYEIT